MYHHYHSTLPTQAAQNFFSEEEEDDDEESSHPPHDDTPERLERLQQHLHEAHHLLIDQDKCAKERDKKLYKIQYLIQHNILPPTQPRPASGLNGISVGMALQQFLQHSEQPLLALFGTNNNNNNTTLSLSTLTCPYEMDPREGYSRWTLSLVLADALWTGKERECLQQAAHAPDDAELVKKAHQVCDHLDTWVMRATAALEGREFKGCRKPYIPGVGKILGTKSLRFREFIAAFQMTAAHVERYEYTTPLREWIQQQEQVILEKQREEKERKKVEKAETDARKRQKWMAAFESSLSQKDAASAKQEETL